MFKQKKCVTRYCPQLCAVSGIISYREKMNHYRMIIKYTPLIIENENMYLKQKTMSMDQKLSHFMIICINQKFFCSLKSDKQFNCFLGTNQVKNFKDYNPEQKKYKKL